MTSIVDIDNIEIDDRCELYNILRSRANECTPNKLKSFEYIRERPRIIQWMMHLQYNTFKLTHETLYLSIAIVDRYHSICVMDLCKVELVCIVSLFIVSKYEEGGTRKLHVNELLNCVNNLKFGYTFSKDQFCTMELEILSVLDYRIMIPTALQFLMIYLKLCKAERKIIFLSCYLLEVNLIDYYNSMKFKAFEIAAASLFEAKMKCGKRPWSATLEVYTKLSNEYIQAIFHRLLGQRRITRAYQVYDVIKEKYSHSRYTYIANRYGSS